MKKNATKSAVKNFSDNPKSLENVFILSPKNNHVSNLVLMSRKLKLIIYSQLFTNSKFKKFSNCKRGF